MSMLKSILCDHIDVCILVKEAVTVTRRRADQIARQVEGRDKEVIFKNYARGCISEMYNTQIDNAKDLDIVIQMYNLILHSENYSKTSGSLWQYYTGEPSDTLTYSELFKYRAELNRKTPKHGNS